MSAIKLNKGVYNVERDELVYDGKHPIDGGAVSIAVSTVTDDETGISTTAVSGVAVPEGWKGFTRGDLLDVSQGVYGIHASGGTPGAIVAEDTEVSDGDTKVVVPVYTSGSFRASEVKADPAITDADKETLRAKGIFLK